MILRIGALVLVMMAAAAIPVRRSMAAMTAVIVMPVRMFLVEKLVLQEREGAGDAVLAVEAKKASEDHQNCEVSHEARQYNDREKAS